MNATVISEFGVLVVDSKDSISVSLISDDIAICLSDDSVNATKYPSANIMVYK